MLDGDGTLFPDRLPDHPPHVVGGRAAGGKRAHKRPVGPAQSQYVRVSFQIIASWHIQRQSLHVYLQTADPWPEGLGIYLPPLLQLLGATILWTNRCGSFPVGREPRSSAPPEPYSGFSILRKWVFRITQMSDSLSILENQLVAC